MRDVAAGFTSQLRRMRGNPDWFLALYTAPLLTVVFVSVFLHAERGDLTAYGVLAPALMALWAMAMGTSGELITSERENGSLEALVAAPARFGVVLLGRVLAVTTVSLAAFVESWVAGWLLTGSPVRIEHPWLFAATLMVTALAMAGTATVMASVFVLARSARVFQNSLSYPFFVLGGVLVPVAFLPEWAQVLSRVVFLSWSSDLLRDTLAAGPVADPALRMAVIALLGALAFWLGHVLLRRTIDRVRTTGSLAHA